MDVLRVGGRAALAVAAWTLAVHAPAVDDAFVWDGRAMVLDDPAITSLGNVTRFFTEATVPLAETAQLPYWRPLTRTLVAALYAVGGASPPVYAVANLAFAAVGTALLLLALRALGASLPVATLAAALFAVHPAHVEAIHWHWGLSTTFAGALSLAAVLAWVRERPAVATALATAAMLAREEAVLLLMAVAAIDVWVRRRPARNAWPLLAAAGLVLVARGAVMGAPPVTTLGPVAWAGSAAAVVGWAAGLLAWPSAIVTVWPLRDPLAVEVVAGATVAGGLGIAFARGSGATRAAIAWVALGVAPWLNVGRFGEYALTEKGLYLASATMCLGVATLPRAAALAIGLGWTGWTMARAPAWQEPVGYFERAVAFAPAFPTLHYMLGMELAERGDYAAAADAFAEATRLEPRHALAWNNLGNCRDALGDRPAAVIAWTHAAELGNPLAAFNLGAAAQARGDAPGAATWFRRWIATDPAPPPDLLARVQAFLRTQP